jgi:hypothetical protein
MPADFLRQLIVARFGLGSRQIAHAMIYHHDVSFGKEVSWQPIGLKTQDADFRVKYFGAKQVNILISKNLQSIKGLSRC